MRIFGVVVAVLLMSACSGVESAGPVVESVPRGRVHSIEGFEPSRHGFAFANSFSGSPLPIDLGTRTAHLPRTFGLCGGMSFAAADYFVAGEAVPRGEAAPERGTSLYNYLYARQAASIGPLGVMGVKFMEWMRLPTSGVGSTQELTLGELPGIVAALKRYEPVVIGLVLVSVTETREPWHNHQVLAYGVDESNAGRTDIRIYDPNYPKRDDVVIRVKREGEGCEIELVVPGRRNGRVRGLFRMSYVAVAPPS